jgi:hypothetical protein
MPGEGVGARRVGCPPLDGRAGEVGLGRDGPGLAGGNDLSQPRRTSVATFHALFNSITRRGSAPGRLPLGVSLVHAVLLLGPPLERGR